MLKKTPEAGGTVATYEIIPCKRHGKIGWCYVWEGQRKHVPEEQCCCKEGVSLECPFIPHQQFAQSKIDHGVKLGLARQHWPTE